MIYYFCLKKGRIPFGVKVLISDIKMGNAYELMKNHIYSTFDLSKSLEHFQEKVTKLLELTNISEWDGHVFREREKKIREIALVLAGECTALLLHNLSQSQDFLDKAEQETQGWWQTSTKKHGSKERQILTVGNVALTLKLPYVVERQTQAKKNQKSTHVGFCPFLRYLGMSEGLTPGVLSTIARYGAIAGSFEAARTTLIDWGVNISLKLLLGLWKRSLVLADILNIDIELLLVSKYCGEVG